MTFSLHLPDPPGQEGEREEWTGRLQAHRPGVCDGQAAREYGRGRSDPGGAEPVRRTSF